MAEPIENSVYILVIIARVLHLQQEHWQANGEIQAPWRKVAS